MASIIRPNAVHASLETDTSDANEITSLAISQNERDLAFLEYMFDDANWTLYKSRTYREAMLQLNRDRVSIIICECQLPDGGWKDVLSHLAPWSDRPRLIVISNHADEHLWSEVLDLGGFDVLATPLKETETAYAIGAAWLDWTNEHGRASPEASKVASQ
jgi:DNA-binding NtrC family response regulator